MATTVALGDEVIRVSRIFCIGRNYVAHAAELGNEAPDEPVVFMKPATAIVPHGKDLHLPRGRGSVHHEAEVVLLVGADDANGLRQVAGVTLGLDLTLREEQARLKARGLPWELAKAFDGSAPLGDFVPVPDDLAEVGFECHVNGERRQRGLVADMLFPPQRLIEFLASRFRLRRGDLVFTGTPEGVGPLGDGDYVEVSSTVTDRFSWQCR